MGVGVRRFIGEEKIAESSKNIKILSTKNDFLTDNIVFNTLSVVHERLTGAMMPRNIGQGYKIASSMAPSTKSWGEKFMWAHNNFSRFLNDESKKLQS